MQIRDQAVAVRPRRAATRCAHGDRPGLRPGGRRRSRPRARRPAGSRRRRHGRPDRGPGRLAHHLAGGEAQRGRPANGGVPVDVGRRQRLLQPLDPEPLERPRAGDGGGDIPARVRSPGMRQPWFASTMIAIPSPTAARTASTSSTSRRQSSSWKRSLTARMPASRSARHRRARSSGGTARHSTRMPAATRCGHPGAATGAAPASGRRGPTRPPRASTRGRRGSRRSRTPRARPRCGTGRRPRAAPSRAASGSASPLAKP